MIVEAARFAAKMTTYYAIFTLIVNYYDSNMFFMVSAAAWIIFSFAEEFERIEQKQKIKELMEIAE